MTPPLKATSTATALEPRETRFYYSNGHCGDKTIYMCEPGIIYGIVGAIIIGLSVLGYAGYRYRHTVSPYLFRVKSKFLAPKHCFYLGATCVNSI